MATTQKEKRISNIEDWIVAFVALISDTLPPAYAEDLQKLTMEKLDTAMLIKSLKSSGETLTD